MLFCLREIPNEPGLAVSSRSESEGFGMRGAMRRSSIDIAKHVLQALYANRPALMAGPDLDEIAEVLIRWLLSLLVSTDPSRAVKTNSAPCCTAGWCRGSGSNAPSVPSALNETHSAPRAHPRGEGLMAAAPVIEFDSDELVRPEKFAHHGYPHEIWKRLRAESPCTGSSAPRAARSGRSRSTPTSPSSASTRSSSSAGPNS